MTVLKTEGCCDHRRPRASGIVAVGIVIDAPYVLLIRHVVYVEPKGNASPNRVFGHRIGDLIAGDLDGIRGIYEHGVGVAEASAEINSNGKAIGNPEASRMSRREEQTLSVVRRVLAFRPGSEISHIGNHLQPAGDLPDATQGDALDSLLIVLIEDRGDSRRVDCKNDILVDCVERCGIQEESVSEKFPLCACFVVSLFLGQHVGIVLIVSLCAESKVRGPRRRQRTSIGYVDVSALGDPV